jgi:hypothetical protein
MAEVQAGKPSACFDDRWGKGLLKPEEFIAIVYATV